jgi:hypothetical protein
MARSVCLLTAYTTDLEDVAAISVPHMRRYAERFGYEFRQSRYDDRQSRKPGWLKIDAISNALSEPYDFVFWVDIDTLFVRKDVDVISQTSPDRDLHIVWHDFAPGGQPSHFNAGVMLLRNTAWTRDFFKQVWKTGQLPHPWTDQATILFLLGHGASLKTDLSSLGTPDQNSIALNQSKVCSWNSEWNVIVGVTDAGDPIIHHYAGMRGTARLSLMQLDEASIVARESSRAMRKRILASLREERLILERLQAVESALPFPLEEIASFTSWKLFRAALRVERIARRKLNSIRLMFVH